MEELFIKLGIAILNLIFSQLVFVAGCWPGFRKLIAVNEIAPIREIRYIYYVYKIFTRLVILLLCSGSLAAQFQDYRFKSWDQQKGLTAPSCISVMQDRNGYIWIATINGISRFNGKNFREIAKFNDTLSIEGEVRKILQDADGVYWVASYDKGLISIDFSLPKEQQVRIFNPASFSGSPPLRTLRCMLDDKSGNIWLGTESDGLYRFIKKTKTFSRIQFRNPYAKFPESIRCMYQLNDSTLWVGIVNGIVYVNTLSGTVTYPKTSYLPAGYHSNPPTVRGICNWQKDTFAVATDRGAFFYLAGTRQFIPVYPDTSIAEYKSQEYHDVIKYSADELWFATIDKGIWYANIKQQKYRYSFEEGFRDETIGRHPVYYFFKDMHGNMWVCHNKGLSYLNMENSKFKNVPFAFHVSQPPTKDFLVAGKNQLAIIRPDSFFTWRYTDMTRKGFNLVYNEQNIGGRRLMFHKKLGYIFINHQGIFYVDTLQHKAVALFLRKDLPDSLDDPMNVSQILVDTAGKDEQWWIAGNENRFLYRFDWSNKKFITYNLGGQTGINSKRISFYYSRMLQDAGGGIWISTRNAGLFYLPDRNKDEFLHFAPDQAPGQRLPGTYVEDLALDHTNQLWATMRGVGLVKITLENNKQLNYDIYNQKRGLTFLNLSQIRVDNQNNLWLSSTIGLYRFDHNKKWFSYFGQANGIRNPVLTLGSAVDSSGHMYFASNDHLLHFNPVEISGKEFGSSLHLLSVSVNERSIDLTNKLVLNLEPEENTIRFEFDLLDFENPTGHYFYCQLVGFDKEWQLLQDVFQQTYKSLPGGKYTFRLKKVNADGSQSKEISLVVNIEDFFYNTTWFRVVAVITALILVLLFVRLYVNNQLEKQRIILEQKRAVEMERMRISAELHDDVGGELSAIGLLSELAQMSDGSNTQQQFKKISVSSSGLVQRMNEIVWALNVKNDSLQNLVYYIHRYSVKYLDDVGITCRFSQPLEIPDHEMDGVARRNIFLLVKEVLNNVIKHSNATEVTIKIEIREHLKIRIQDNGKGIDPEQLAIPSGNGIKNMQKRVSDLKARQQITSDEGTTIMFEIPL